MHVISTMKYYNIYSDGNNHFIVHNMRKNFSDGHTHIDNFKTAKYITYLALYKKLPKNHHLSVYLIQSLIRISTDKEYIDELNEFMNEMKNKKI